MKQGMTLTDMAAELERQVASKKDFLAPARSLEMHSNGSIKMKVGGMGEFDVQETAHEQLASKLGIPQKYYDRMKAEKPELLADNVNAWLARSDDKRLVRTLDGGMRAFLSHRYRPLDNHDLAETVLPIMTKMGCVIESCALTVKRLYIKAVTPKLAFEVKKGDMVNAGIVVSNSEIGSSSLRVEPMIFRLVCTNGLIAPDASLRKFHVGKGAEGEEEGASQFYRDETMAADDKAFWMKVRDVVAGAFQKEVFERIAHDMTASASDKMSGDPVKIVEVVQKRFGLQEHERGSILKHLIDGGDLSRYGMMNAVTRTSQDLPDYDRATEFERLGGDILALPKADWQTIAEAK